MSQRRIFVVAETPAPEELKKMEPITFRPLIEGYSVAEIEERDFNRIKILPIAREYDITAAFNAAVRAKRLKEIAHV
jgi:hypothetical protein